MRSFLGLSTLVLFACAASIAPSDSGTDAPHDAITLDAGPALLPHPVLTITRRDTRFVTREHMIASFEMQQSGEPLAEALGRDLAGFDRNLLPTDMYADPTTGIAVRDLVGFATGIESYEYSKQPMNQLALESGAGVALVYGPIVNPSGVVGTAAQALLRPRIERYAIGSHLGVRALPDAVPDRYYVLPAPTAWAPNVFGWRGLWPTLMPYRSFDGALALEPNLYGNCAMILGDGDDGLGTIPPNYVGDYECDYNPLNLARSAMDTSIGPGAAGWTAWKYALWITNYLQIMHDVAGTAIGTVDSLALVGTEANTVIGTQSALGGDPTMTGVSGTYLGSSDIEGFQAGVMIDELDNAAEAWLTQLTTTDGAALSGFGATGDALAYDYRSPLRWIPETIRVTETSDPSGSPPPAYAIESASSTLLDLLGLGGAYAQLYAVTDEHNPSSGGTDPARAWFDGDPFPHDDQIANGEATLHDRALAMMKLAIVTLDRVHRDPASGCFLDTVTFDHGVPTRGTTLEVTSAAYAIVSLRAMRRALGAQLTLYSNGTPDLAVATTALDGTSMDGSPDGASIAMRLTSLIRTHADLLFDHLTDADGHAYAGFDLATGTTTASANALDDHTAAIDGLLEAYLATGDTRYRDRATLVFAHAESTLWDARLRVYGPVDATGSVTYTPLRFGMLSRALRQMFLLVGAQPGHETLAALLEARIARMSKLVLNGWDDRDDDDEVDWPSECLLVTTDLPRGGLQMAERALTGEPGSQDRAPTMDRDHDCVPEIDDAELPAALAAEVVISVTDGP